MKSKLTSGDIKKLLIANDLEQLTISRPSEQGVIDIKANKLHPVSGWAKKIYVKLPVTVRLTPGSGGTPHRISGGVPTSSQKKDAEKFIRDLVANNQLDGFGEHNPSATHRLEKNDQGQSVVVRSKFKMF